MINKNKAYSYLTRAFKKEIGNAKEIQLVISSIYEKHNLPVDQLSDYLTLRNQISYADDFIVFCFLEYYDPKNLSTYYNTTEINKYSHRVFKIRNVFPIKFDVIQITPTQWIGRVSVKELMKLRDAQLINYNENAQRTMRRVIDGVSEYYQITLNKKAINGIVDSYENETYIPNTITLNIPDDAVFDYSENQITIKSATHFDILDGYHRYIAMSKIYNINKKFDYMMELRLVNFSNDKAKQFIWQEDQKTKMRKIDSDSLNQNDSANKIVQRLNADPTFNLAGMISRNKGIINSAELSQAISVIYMKNISKGQEPTRIIQVTRELKEKLNYLTEQNEELLTKQWKRKFIICVILCCRLEIPKEDLLDEINSMYDTIKNDKLILKSTVLSQVDVTRLEKTRK